MREREREREERCIAVLVLVIYTWSFISEINGDTTIAMLPFLSRKLSKAKGSRAKQRLFPLPVGRLTNTSFPSKKLAMALFC